MNTFLYPEDLVANALIEKIGQGGTRCVTQSEIDAYSERVAGWWLRNKGVRVTALTSHCRINDMLAEYPNYFRREVDGNGEMTIWLQDGKRSDDLRHKFRSYLTMDMLLSFIQSYPT